ncbi:MAG: sigma-70 family RNA polymerase sigma factor [Caldilineaceae bacterium]|nr:sigma-70 family RNA polymerase sigma factor [Caldilineaceae bacterium]
MTISAPNLPLDKLIADCRQDRSARNFQRPSSACVQIFRLAFAGDQKAWDAIYSIFSGLVRHWLSQEIAPNKKQYIEYDLEDLVQDVFANFHRWAPKATGLTATEHLDPLMNYLRTTCKTTVGQVGRKRRPPQVESYPVVDRVSTDPPHEQIELRRHIDTILERLLKTDDEKIIFNLRFECDIPPREIVGQMPERFDMSEVRATVQRLKRRMQNDPEMQQLAETLRQKSLKFASLQIEEDSGPKRGGSMEEHCPLDELDLLDYITGLASAEVRERIESSPVCQLAAATLLFEIGPLLAVLYRRNCPTVEQLVDYQEHRLFSTQRLIIHQHVQSCPLCQSEMEHFHRIDLASQSDKGGWLRRIVEAIFQPPTLASQPIRGETHLNYRAEDIHLALNLRPDTDLPGRWTLRGQVRSSQGMLIGNEVASAVLISTTNGEIQESEWSEERRSFAFRQVEAGVYRLHLGTSEAEIVVPSIAVGNAE